MKERDEFAGCSLERFLVNQAYASAGGLLKLRRDVVSAKCHVMDPLTAVRNKLGDGALW